MRFSSSTPASGGAATCGRGGGGLLIGPSLQRLDGPPGQRPGKPRRRAPASRFAEWYVWAKCEVSTDNGVGLGVAQAAIEALEGGADEQAARLAARRSTAGHSVGLLSRIPPRRRAYAEWYDWARREIGGDRERLHAAADAAMRRLDGGGGAAGGRGLRSRRCRRRSLPSVTAVGPGPQPAGPGPQLADRGRNRPARLRSPARRRRHHAAATRPVGVGGRAARHAGAAEPSAGGGGAARLRAGAGGSRTPRAGRRRTRSAASAPARPPRQDEAPAARRAQPRVRRLLAASRRLPDRRGATRDRPGHPAGGGRRGRVLQHRRERPGHRGHRPRRLWPGARPDRAGPVLAVLRRAGGLRVAGHRRQAGPAAGGDRPVRDTGSGSGGPTAATSARNIPGADRAGRLPDGRLHLAQAGACTT